MFAITFGWHVLISGPDRDDAEKPAKQEAVVEEIARMREEGTIRLAATSLGPFNTFEFGDEVRASRALRGGAKLLPDGSVDLQDSECSLPMPGWLAIGILDGHQELEKAKVEYAVFGSGPISAAIFARTDFLLQLLVLYTPVYLGWRTLALFMLGAGFVKLGFLGSSKSPKWRTAAVWGLGLGLPMSAGATWLRAKAWRVPGGCLCVCARRQDTTHTWYHLWADPEEFPR